MLAIKMNEKNPERYTLHSGKNFYPTCGGQMRMEREKRNKLGHWATLSSMAERYDRSTCSTELQLRNDILSAIKEGWAPVESFQIPAPVPAVTSYEGEVNLDNPDKISHDVNAVKARSVVTRDVNAVKTKSVVTREISKRLVLLERTTKVRHTREVNDSTVCRPKAEPVISRRIKLTTIKKKVGRPMKRLTQ